MKIPHHFSILNLFLLLLILACSSCHLVEFRASDPPSSYPLESVARHPQWMVATESPPATKIGVQVLEKGGNAFDAAIAISFALSVYRPQSTGIGGGGFVLGKSKSSATPFFLDLRERAPLKASADYYSQFDAEFIAHGGGSVAVPGLVQGLYQLFQDYGSKKIPWKELVSPSVALAADGFAIYPHLSRAIATVAPELENPHYSALRKLLTHDGKPLHEGDMLRQPELAKTLHAIARSGPNAFYRGKIARSIVDEVQKSRGTLRLSDLQRYKPVYRTPISGGFVGFTIYGAPPPSSGGLTNQIMLNLYQSFQADYPALSPKDLELRTEILRSGFYLRNTYLGDPNFVSIPTHTLLSPDLTEKLRKKILDLPQNRSFSKLSTFGDNGGTTHFCVVDGERNVVSSTQSINYYFGSLLMAKDTGVILNNTMNDFATGTSNLFELKDGSPNSIEGGKTPLSSMSPTLVYRNDRLLLSLGSPGGPKIISAVWNVLLNRLYHNFPLPEAVAAPRVHHQGQPASLFHDGIGVGLTPRLVNSPFPLRHTPYGIGNVSAIELLESGSYLGVTDPRREGLATGVLQ